MWAVNICNVIQQHLLCECSNYAVNRHEARSLQKAAGLLHIRYFQNFQTRGILFGVPESLRCQMSGWHRLVSDPIWYFQARKNKNENTQSRACLGTWTYGRYVHTACEALSSCRCYYHWEWHQSKLNLETLRSENWKSLVLYNLTQIRHPANKTSLLDEPEYLGWNDELRSISGMSSKGKKRIPCFWLQ